MRKKQLAFGGERLSAANAAAFLIKLHSQALLQGQQAISHALLSDMQNPCRQPQAALPRQLDKGRHLVSG